MSRFVLLSFAFLGWGFYELSGGRDFTPPATVASSAPRQAQEANHEPPLQTVLAVSGELGQTAKFRQSAKQRAAALVERQVLKPVASRSTIASNRVERNRVERPAADPNRRQEVALSQIISAQNQLLASDQPVVDQQGSDPETSRGDVLRGGLLALTAQHELSQQRQAQVATRPEPATATSAQSNANEDMLDIRRIRASRVNMRQGPGTIYPVVDRLLVGEEVLVFEDSGTGWLHLRTRKGDRVGWVAASLVSRKSS